MYTCPRPSSACAQILGCIALPAGSLTQMWKCRQQIIGTGTPTSSRQTPDVARWPAQLGSPLTSLDVTQPPNACEPHYPDTVTVL
jgi:hypothetical protein